MTEKKTVGKKTIKKKTVITTDDIIVSPNNTSPEYVVINVNEEELLRKMIIDNVGMPTFTIVRDVFRNNPGIDGILSEWARKDYYVILPPGNNIRDGYLTESGRLYALNTFGIK